MEPKFDLREHVVIVSSIYFNADFPDVQKITEIKQSIRKTDPITYKLSGGRTFLEADIISVEDVKTYALEQLAQKIKNVAAWETYVDPNFKS